MSRVNPDWLKLKGVSGCMRKNVIQFKHVVFKY